MVQDSATFNVTVPLEHIGHLGFRQVGMDAMKEEVGARFSGAVIVIIAMTRWGIVPGIYVDGR